MWEERHSVHNGFPSSLLNTQLLDLPGIIEGAKDGKGRGRQVIAGECCRAGGSSQSPIYPLSFMLGKGQVSEWLLYGSEMAFWALELLICAASISNAVEALVSFYDEVSYLICRQWRRSYFPLAWLDCLKVGLFLVLRCFVSSWLLP